MADSMRSVVWVDAGGFTSITKIRTDAGASTIFTDMLACINADWLQGWEGDLNTNGAPAPTAATYEPGIMRAALTFQCSDYSQVVLILPAPKAAIFHADGETVDPTVGVMSTLITDCLGHLESATGAKATAFVGGTLQTSTRSPNQS